MGGAGLKLRFFDFDFGARLRFGRKGLFRRSFFYLNGSLCGFCPRSVCRLCVLWTRGLGFYGSTGLLGHDSSSFHVDTFSIAQPPSIRKGVKREKIPPFIWQFADLQERPWRESSLYRGGA